jgi:hypothetical protein
MPVFYIIDNEFIVFLCDFKMTKYRNDLSFVTECSKCQLVNRDITLLLSNAYDLIFDGEKHHPCPGFKPKFLK